jgi:hypothetical protein
MAGDEPGITAQPEGKSPQEPIGPVTDIPQLEEYPTELPEQESPYPPNALTYLGQRLEQLYPKTCHTNSTDNGDFMISKISQNPMQLNEGQPNLLQGKRISLVLTPDFGAYVITNLGDFDVLSINLENLESWKPTDENKLLSIKPDGTIKNEDTAIGKPIQVYTFNLENLDNELETIEEITQKIDEENTAICEEEKRREELNMTIILRIKQLFGSLKQEENQRAVEDSIVESPAIKEPVV